MLGGMGGVGRWGRGDNKSCEVGGGGGGDSRDLGNGGADNLNKTNT